MVSTLNEGGSAVDVESLIHDLPENAELGDKIDRLSSLSDTQLKGIMSGVDDVASQAAAVILWQRKPRKAK